MRAINYLSVNSAAKFCSTTSENKSNIKRVFWLQLFNSRFPVILSTQSKQSSTSSAQSSFPLTAADFDSGQFKDPPRKLEKVEEGLEKVIYGCRFFAILAVWGSLVGSFLCFIKGCTYVFTSFQHYFVDRAKVIFSLVEALDVYLLGTVMLVFGMGLYELFISNLDKAKSYSEERSPNRSNLFGLFTLKERPRWLEIKSVNELKTKLGHVIVMLLLINLFEKTKKAAILTPVDLLCFAASVLFSSGCLFLLSKLNNDEDGEEVHE